MPDERFAISATILHCCEATLFVAEFERCHLCAEVHAHLRGRRRWLALWRAVQKLGF